jgi:hypothetical protein
MKPFKHLRCCVLIAAAIFLYQGEVQAADLEPLPAVQELAVQGSLTIYGWYTFVDGTVGVDGLGPVDVGNGSSDLLDILDGFFMANGELQYGKFGIYGDFIYAALSDKNTGPGGLTTTGWDLDGTVFTGAGAYVIVASPQGWIQVVAGARYWGMKAGIDVGPLSASKSVDWVDFVGGFRGRHDLTPAWFLEGTALAGAGGSEFMWDVYGGLGYSFNQNFSASLGYRGLGLDYNSGGLNMDTVFHGPVAGLTLRL